MNMQAMLQQAKKMQKDMLSAKDEIDARDYISKQSLVEVTMKGNKKVTSIKINAEFLDKDDIEILEESIKIAINDNENRIDKDIQDKLGKFGNIPGLF